MNDAKDINRLFQLSENILREKEEVKKQNFSSVKKKKLQENSELDSKFEAILNRGDVEWGYKVQGLDIYVLQLDLKKYRWELNQNGKAWVSGDFNTVLKACYDLSKILNAPDVKKALLDAIEKVKNKGNPSRSSSENFEDDTAWDRKSNPRDYE